MEIFSLLYIFLAPLSYCHRSCDRSSYVISQGAQGQCPQWQTIANFQKYYVDPQVVL